MTLIKSGARSARALLDQLLDRPSPLALVQSLPVESVVRLIERVGLEDLGDLVSLLSPEQLTHVLDRDLWSSQRPGADEAFDAERFALWLTLWVEESPGIAAKKLSEMDFDLVVLGISQLVLVLDLEQLAQLMLRGGFSEDCDPLDKALESHLYQEFEQYRVVARDAGSFDVIAALLAELNMHDYGSLCELLSRCCALASEYIRYNGGLCEVLSSAEMCEVDVAGAREERREAQGHVPASSALAFLRLARETPWQELWKSVVQDPVTRAHKRASTPAERGRSSRASLGSPALAAGRESASGLLLRLESLLQEEPVPMSSLPRAKVRASLLSRGLARLCAQDSRSYERCVLEASYLANVVLAGVGTRELRYQPNDAAVVAFALCELGADEAGRALGGSAAERALDLSQRLVRGGLVQLFQLGFHRMCEPELPLSASRHGALARLRTMLEAQGLARGPSRKTSARRAARTSRISRSPD